MHMDPVNGDMNDSHYVQPQTLTTYFTGDDVKTTVDYENGDDARQPPHHHHENAHDSSPDPHAHQHNPADNAVAK